MTARRGGSANPWSQSRRRKARLSVAIERFRRFGGPRPLSTATDNYGDFEFEDLPSDTECVLTVEKSGYKPRELRLSTANDINVGTIVLEPSH